jgi:hypothetical protein
MPITLINVNNLPVIKKDSFAALSGIARRTWEIYLKEVDHTFEMEGPGWRPLANITLAVKASRGAPYIENILKQFDYMRTFIELKDETTNRDVKKFSVGLFKDGKAALHPERVDWGFTHEYGGFETAYTNETGEIATGGITEKALEGESEIEGVVSNKRIRGSDVIFYVPARPFLGNTFDRVISLLIDEMILRINRWLDKYQIVGIR